MGTTSTDIYIKRGISDKAGFGELLTEYFRTQGYKVAEDYGKSDLSVFVLWDESSGWIALKSSFFEDTNTSIFQAMASDLRRTFKSEVMSVAVLDSDICLICYADLQQRGTKLFVSDPGSAYEGLYPPAAAKNNIAELNSLLVDPDKENALEEVWTQGTLFAEERRDELLELFGIKQNVDFLVDPETMSDVLAFCFDVVDISAKGYRIVEMGLPMLEPSGYGTAIVNNDVYVGSFLNVGGPAVGLSLVLFGDLIDSSINNGSSCFELDVIEAWRDTEKLREEPTRMQISKCRLQENQGRYYFQADFDHFEIPPGLIVTKRSKKADDLIGQYSITFRFTVTTIIRDDNLSGDLCIAAIPYENWPDGQSIVTAEFLWERPDYAAQYLAEQAQRFGDD